MSETPGGPEHYTPPSEPPPMIGDAALEWTLEQEGGAGSAMYHAPPPSPAPHAAPVPYAAPPPGTQRTAQGLAITALVLGIIAFISGWVPVWGAIVGLLAVIFGIVALAKGQSKGMAITGIVTGFLGTAVSALMVVLFIVLGNGFDDYADVNDYVDDDAVDYGIGSGSETLGPVPADGALVVAEESFGPTSYDDGEVWWVVILDNPSPNPYPGADVTVNALDSAGQVVDSSWDFLALPSGRTALTGVFFDLDGAQVASLEVVGPATDALGSQPDSGTLTTSELAVTTDDWSTTVSGTVTSSFSEDLYGASGVIVARDAAGEIVGAASTYTEGLASGESASFDAFFYDPMPADATFEAFWSSY